MSRGGYIQKRTAAKDPIYMAVWWACIEAIQTLHFFQKDKIVRKVRLVEATPQEGMTVDLGTELDLSTHVDNLNWRYIREWIQDYLDCELIPVADKYFNRRKAMLQARKQGEEYQDELHVSPLKFAASGDGRKTTGYVLADEDHHKLVQALYKQHSNQAMGKRRKVAQRVRRAAKKDPALLNDPQLAHDVARVEHTDRPLLTKH